MKFNFRKISAIGASVLLTGMTLGVAAAANYPAPFVVGGSADVAVVYGTGAGVSTLDLIQAGNIQSNLQSSMGAAGTTTTGGTVSGGDSVKLEKSSTKFQLGKSISDIISTSITDDSPGSGLTLLVDGVFIDSDNDEKDYTQKIDIANTTLEMFDDDDYKADTPTIGMKFSSAAHVLNYTLDFTDEPEWDDITSTNIEIMGKNYFILSYTNQTTINLLDSANTATVTEGETITVNVAGTSYEVSIQYIASAEVKLNVNGASTNSLAEAQTQKLSDGAYVGIKDIMHDSKTGSLSSVEFSIGTGKLVLKHATDVEINDLSVSNMKTYITNSVGSGASTISKIAIEWKADDELFLAPDSEITMPGFEAVKLSFTGMLYPSEEVITVKGGSTTYVTLDNFPLKDSVEDINILYGDSSNFTGIGKDSTHLLRTSNETSIVFDKDTDEYFVASFNDGSNAESYLMRATDFGQVGTTTANRTDIQYKKDGVWTTIKDDAKITDVVTLGNVQLTVGAIQKSAENTVNLTAATNCNFHTLYSAEGLEVFLPWNGTAISPLDASARGSPGAFVYNASTNVTTFDLIFAEEDRNGNIGDGGNITAVLGWNSASTKEAYVSDVGNESVTFVENGDNTKKWVSHKYSELASALQWDKSGDQYELQITYHGSESYGEVYLNAPSTTVVAGTTTTGTATSLGDVLVKDSEVSSVSTKNLIVIGGSCINSAAAKVLGVATGTCGAAFTEATGVGSGEFLIKGVSGSYTAGKIALVVAGYEAADTVNAATYLRNQVVDTSKEYKGTSSTSATMVTTEA